MSELSDVLDNLVVANRILAHENVVDAYGHVSIRHPSNPKRYFIARSLAPELVTRADLIEFDLEGNPVGGDTRTPYLERFIHGAIFEARPDVHAVVHAHAEDTLPFGISNVPLKPVIHSGSFIGPTVPVWDIADEFGKDTDLLVRNMVQGRDLARVLAGNNVTLMRGHGFAAVSRSLIEVVRLSVYLPRNARVQMAGMRLGDIKPLNPGEIGARAVGYKPNAPETWRAWRYWANRAGCGDHVGEPPTS
jgi:ribulose-5-phosphate 4-epimerase/fuculose-1-phosphate aldolase